MPEFMNEETGPKRLSYLSPVSGSLNSIFCVFSSIYGFKKIVF